MSLDQMLRRLEKVKKTGAQRWIARCPAHQDKSPSLSIRETADGRILLHCFGGCGALDIVDALGLRLRDLFQDSSNSNSGATGMAGHIPLLDMIPFLDHELLVCALIMQDMLGARALTEDQWSRFAQASSRIGKIRDSLRSASVKGVANGGT
jgi:hypothetical protein